jgi:DHA1 family bicyclomycin/chloramphenicol resistance-like MFS transporter
MCLGACFAFAMRSAQPYMPPAVPETGASGGQSLNRIVLWALLTVLIAYQPLSTDTLLPSLPSLTRAFSTTEAVIQWTLSGFFIGLAVAQLFYGPLSDRFGRRPVLIVGIGIYLAGSLACLFAPTVDTLIGARVVQAFGACAAPTIARAVVRDLFERAAAARALAYLGATMGLIPAVAPIIGGYLVTDIGWRAIFVFMTVIGVLTMLALVFAFGETNTRRSAEALNLRHMAASYRTLLGKREFVGFATTVAVIMCALVMFVSGSPFVLIRQFGLSAEGYAYYFAAIALAYSVGTVLAGRLTLRVGIERMVLIGGVIGVAAAGVMVALAWSRVEHPAAVIAPMTVFMVCIGFVAPNGFAGAISPYPTMAGAASSLLGFFQLGLAALATVLVANTVGWSMVSMTTVMLALALTSLAAYYLLIWRRHARHGGVMPAPAPGDEAAAAEIEAAANRPG